LIELNLIAGANFALSWVWKRHPQLNFNTISQGIPPQRLRMVSAYGYHDWACEKDYSLIAWSWHSIISRAALFRSTFGWTCGSMMRVALLCN
jgi:hypothetical protein